MRLFALFLLLTLAGCGGSARVVASSPGTVVVEVPAAREPSQAELDLASAECRRHGYRQAQLAEAWTGYSQRRATYRCADRQ